MAELLNPHCCRFSEGLSSSIRWGGSWGVGVLFKFGGVGVGSLYSSLMVLAHGSKHQVLPPAFCCTLWMPCEIIQTIEVQEAKLSLSNKQITQKTWRVGENLYSWICLSHIIGMKEQNTFTKLWFKTEKARRKPSWMYMGFCTYFKNNGVVLWLTENRRLEQVAPTFFSRKLEFLSDESVQIKFPTGSK